MSAIISDVGQTGGGKKTTKTLMKLLCVKYKGIKLVGGAVFAVVGGMMKEKNGKKGWNFNLFQQSQLFCAFFFVVGRKKKILNVELE
jgi:hypothetical protein